MRGTAEIGLEAGAVLDQHNRGKHDELRITESAFTDRRKRDSIAGEARLDGSYVIRTNLPAATLTVEQTVSADRSLARVERAFRGLKRIDLEIRPVLPRSCPGLAPVCHGTAPRGRAPVFLCMRADDVESHRRSRLAPILFDEHDRAAAAAERPSTVAPAERSPAAPRKAAARRTDDGLPVHRFRSLLSDLATLCLNKVSLPSNPKYRFELPTKPPPLQARAAELLGLSLGLSSVRPHHQPLFMNRIQNLRISVTKTSD